MKVADLTGVLLDYWAARTACIDAVVSDLYPDGSRAMLLYYGRDAAAKLLDGRIYSPSTNDAEGSAIIGQYWIGLNRPIRGQAKPLWCALADYVGLRRPSALYQPVVVQWGETHLIAATRCFVAMHHGEEVPDIVLAAGMATLTDKEAT